MSVQRLPIVVYGNPLLKEISKEVVLFDKALELLAEQMYVTMKHANGIGLAGVQVGVLKRIILVEIEEQSERLTLVNPIITDHSKETHTDLEGCLSIPGILIPVKRHQSIHVQFQTLQGTPSSLSAQDLLARVIQHEVDHINGVLFIQHLPKTEYNKIETTLHNLSHQA